MTGRSYRLTPLAVVDLENIWRYTFETWSVEQADSYLTDLVAAFEQLALGQKRGQIVDVRPGYFKHMCGSHIVYFRQHGDWCEIIRILHARQYASRDL